MAFPFQSQQIAAAYSSIIPLDEDADDAPFRSHTDAAPTKRPRISERHDSETIGRTNGNDDTTSDRYIPHSLNNHVDHETFDNTNHHDVPSTTFAKQLIHPTSSLPLSYQDASIPSASNSVSQFSLRYKVTYDPVHAYMQLDATVLAVMDTPEFQRLRDLKQLGTCYYVFPGASHNRFEHSLGVSYLSGSMIDHFVATQPSLHISAAETSYVRIAGLVHDLGHGPFSHVFDGQFIPAVRPDVSWHHEEMSAQLLDVLLDDNEVDVLDDVYASADGDGVLPPELRSKSTREITGREVVKYMLHPAAASNDFVPESGAAYRDRLLQHNTASKGLLYDNSRAFLFEIVANAQSGIDTDKFDYLARDCHNLGLASSFDHRRVLYSARVMPNGHIAYHAKEAMSVAEMFHTRYRLFRSIYLHRATRSVEAMICDALRAADGAWNGRLANAINDPRAYRTLTDAVLLEIQFSGTNRNSMRNGYHGSQNRSIRHGGLGETGEDDEEDAPQLRDARRIVENLRKRRLYRFVDELLIPAEWTYSLPRVRPEDLSTRNTDPSVVLTPDDIIVSDVKLGYGLGRRDPLTRTAFWYPAPQRAASVVATMPPPPPLIRRSETNGSARFFGSSGFPEEWDVVQPSKISHLLPHVFEERLLRVYSRETDKTSPAAARKMHAIASAFRRFLREHGLPVSAAPDPASRAYHAYSQDDGSGIGSEGREENNVQSQLAASIAAANVSYWQNTEGSLGLGEAPRRGEFMDNAMNGTNTAYRGNNDQGGSHMAGDTLPPTAADIATVDASDAPTPPQDANDPLLDEGGDVILSQAALPRWYHGQAAPPNTTHATTASQAATRGTRSNDTGAPTTEVGSKPISSIQTTSVSSQHDAAKKQVRPPLHGNAISRIATEPLPLSQSLTPPTVGGSTSNIMNRKAPPSPSRPSPSRLMMTGSVPALNVPLAIHGSTALPVSSSSSTASPWRHRIELGTAPMRETGGKASGKAIPFSGDEATSASSLNTTIPVETKPSRTELSSNPTDMSVRNVPTDATTTAGEEELVILPGTTTATAHSTMTQNTQLPSHPPQQNPPPSRSRSAGASSHSSSQGSNAGSNTSGNSGNSSAASGTQSAQGSLLAWLSASQPQTRPPDPAPSSSKKQRSSQR